MTSRRMLLFAKNGQKITRMLIGLAEDENIPFVQYDDIADIIVVVKAELDKM